MAAVTESRLATKTVQDQKNAPWWLAENGLTVLRNRYFLKTVDGKFTEDINGLIDRVCANQAHIDGLWAVAHDHLKCLTGLLPHDLTDKDIHALEDPNSKERALWPKEATVAYVKAFEKSFTEYRTLMRRGDYLPATPILINSGCRSGMLYSCFVIPMDDTLMRKPDEPEELCGIFDCVKAVVAVQKAGGGTGVSVSRTRPRGDHIHGGKANEAKGITIGNTTGSIAWLEEVSDAVKHIEQGSARHGANMGILRIDHPDIVEFCTAKDGIRLRNFNISVGITDAFISLLENTPDSVWMVTNPRTKKVAPCRDVLGRIKDPEHNWTVQDLWDLIVFRAWDVGDPGLWFIDRVNATNPTPNLGKFECCNPCQPAWATLLTPEGIRTMGQVDVGDIIWSGKHWTKVTHKIETGIRPVWAFYTESGVFYGTKDHRIVQNGSKIPVEDATCIDGAAWPPNHQLHLETPRSKSIFSRQLISEEAVFDITVDVEEHTYWTGGLLVSNCGEQELLPNESCNLGSIILSRFVDPSREIGTDELPAGIDWVRLGQAVQVAVRFHDAVIDSSIYTVEVPAIRKATKATRKIGLGVMGWWDMLVRLGITYESDEALRLADRIMSFINKAALAESTRLADARGVFPAWEGSREKELGHKVRNATRTTIAPTGTISIIAGPDVTGGIEPSFGLAYLQDTPGTGGEVEVINLTFQEWLDAQVASKRFHPDEARQILEAAFRGESVSALVQPVLTDRERVLFKIANEIDIEWHIKHQAAFQRHTDNSVSKTINAANNAEVKDIEAAYRMAISYGLNGITVFRDGCLAKTGQTQPMSYKGGANADPHAQMTHGQLQRGKPCDIRPIRPQIAISMKSLFGTVHLHITVDPRTEEEFGCELELFGCVGKGGDLALAQMEGIGRLASQILRLGGSLELVADQLSGIGSKHTTLTSGGRRLSLEDTVGHMLLKYIEAKDRYGLRALLLCEVDEAELLAFITAPLAGKQKALDEIWGGEGDYKAKAKKLADNGHIGNLHGITCATCRIKILIVGGCAFCPICGDSSC